MSLPQGRKPGRVSCSCLLSCVISDINNITRGYFYILTGGSVIVNRNGLYNRNGILNSSIEGLTPSHHVRYALILGGVASTSARRDQNKEQHVYYADW